MILRQGLLSVEWNGSRNSSDTEQLELLNTIPMRRYSRYRNSRCDELGKLEEQDCSRGTTNSTVER
jgi:hypothetical protein